MRLQKKIFDFKIRIPCSCIIHVLLCIMLCLLTFTFSNRLGIILSSACWIGSFTFSLETMSIASMNTQRLLHLPKNRLLGDVASWGKVVNQIVNTWYFCFCFIIAFLSGILLCIESIVYFIFLIIFWVASYITYSMLYSKIEGNILSRERSFPFLKRTFSAFVIYVVYFPLLLLYFLIVKKDADLLANEIILLSGGLFGSLALVIYILRVHFKREN